MSAAANTCFRAIRLPAATSLRLHRPGRRYAGQYRLPQLSDGFYETPEVEQRIGCLDIQTRSIAVCDICPDAGRDM